MILESRPSEKKPNVLLVDDRSDNLLVLEALLEPLDVRLLKATSGSEALAQLLAHDCAVVLLDVKMPGMGGFETARLIRGRERSRDIPIIFISAFDLSASQSSECYATGAVDFLQKPVRPEILQAKVAVFLALYRKNEELREQAERLQAANRELDHFAYSVSHDLRAPLRSLAGFSQLIVDDYAGRPLEGRGLDYAKRIVDSSRRMDAMITGILDYCRLSRMDVVVEPVSLGELVDEVLAGLQAEIAGRRAEVTVHRPLPSVKGHRVMLSQVLCNLLGNAMKFVAPGVEPRICLSARTVGEGVRIEVCDNGIGIDPRDRESIFEVFRRPESARDYPGTGIGLAIVKRAVDRMGGRAGVDPRSDGPGSTFWVELAA